ncbi:darcynin family protein [Geodermatophilus sp. URMC 62]|uniref:darcynin family protein n=1 Tax=Geodermatophilus sp. URMC 62 TaxID=3423414 RepID=UPI00406CE98C
MTGNGLHYVAFLHLTALPAWLTLSREQRQEVVGRDVEPVLAAHPAVRVRWVDVEAFSAESSDVLIAETDDLREWNRLVEALRDTCLFADPLFRLDRVLVGAEDGFRDYEHPAD